MTVRLKPDTTNLALLAAAPAIWISHFLVSYTTAAVWCARFAGTNGSLSPLTTPFVVLTALAVGGIALVGTGAYRRHRHGESDLPHDFDSAGDRHRFLGFATLLLAGLSLVATLFNAVAVFMFDRCSG